MDRPGPPDADGLSCAELSSLDEQSAMINRLMATLVGVYLYRLLQSRDLDMMATFTSLDGVSRSTFITGGRTVFPTKVGLTTLPSPVEEEEAEGETDCPGCGGEIIEGQDEVYGVLVSIRFCGHCHWRIELCPACGANIGEEEMALETGQTALGLTCSRCDWAAPYPPEHQPEEEPRPSIS
jgi:predicted RNA-binding Zn-ribbon protein involved in translation (DUF1610 family)